MHVVLEKVYLFTKEAILHPLVSFVLLFLQISGGYFIYVSILHNAEDLFDEYYGFGFFGMALLMLSALLLAFRFVFILFGLLSGEKRVIRGHIILSYIPMIGLASYIALRLFLQYL